MDIKPVSDYFGSWDKAKLNPPPLPTEYYKPDDLQKSKMVPIDIQRSFAVEGYVTADGYERLQRGLQAKEMEEKWNIFTEDNRVNFHRSWTGNKIFDAPLQDRGDRYYIGYVTYEGNQEKYKIMDLEEPKDNFLAILASLGVFLTTD